MIPYRSAGPVTNEEYLSREDRYDKQLKEKYGWDPTGKSLDERRIKMREFREDAYQKLCDAVYLRRGWDNNGVPKIEKIKELGLADTGVLPVLEKYYNK
jgi:aldehyde:ferredoxin oxidoreductase